MGSEFSLLGFWLPCALMGLGIALDVAVATIARFRDSSQTWMSWTLPITITHITFPALGYYSWWWFGSAAPSMLLPLGVAAAIIVALFLYEAFCDWTDFEPKISLSSLFERILPNVSKGAQGGIVAILAVSLDALFSGPAKASQTEVAHWSNSEVFLSFFVAGVVVAVIAQLALLAAKILRGLDFSNIRPLVYWCLGGKFLEAGVIGGFGVLSLWSGLSIWIGGANLLLAIILSSGLFLGLFIIFFRRLYRVQMSDLIG